MHKYIPMKKIVLFIFILLITQLVFAEETLKQGDSTTVGGKTFTLVAVGETNNAIVSVDGIKGIVNLNQKKEINGINVLLTSAVYMGEDSIAKFILESISEKEAASTPHVVVCGDNVCEGTEDKDNCCKDCGCKYGYGCENNKCVNCIYDSDCGSGLFCSTNYTCTQCEYIGDCQTGYDCVNSKCQKMPQCTVDRDCVNGEICNSQGYCISVSSFPTPTDCLSIQSATSLANAFALACLGI